MLGGWLGAAAFADFAVTQNFSTVDRFLQSPGSNATALELQKIGMDRERPILRRNAGEENGFLFEDWETAELGVAVVLILLLLVGGKRSNAMLALAGLMLMIVAGQRFYLSPDITDLGRQLAERTASDPLNAPLTARFWTAHGIYSGAEIAKLLLGFALAVLLALPRKRDSDRAPREPEPELIAGKRMQGT